MTALDLLRRGWCPSVLTPMATGDGLLVRLHPPGARLTAAQARAVAEAARACGNGLMDLSGRGNLQIRGVRPDSHARLVALLSDAGLARAPAGPAPRHAVILSPLAGEDPSDLTDAARLGEDIDAALAAADDLQPLPPKFAVVVDGGGRMPLDDVDGDVRVVACGSSQTPRLALALASPNGPVSAGACALADGAATVRGIATAFSAAIRAGAPARRIRDLPPEARARLAAFAAIEPGRELPAREPGPRLGPIPLGEGRVAVGLGLPFGRFDADLLDRLASWGERLGSGDLRPSPWRSILVPGVGQDESSALVASARETGLVVEPADPRTAITACSGAPACARATVATQADADRLAKEAGALLRGESTMHLSGCAKGCARRGPADLTLVGEDGHYGVVIRGAARHTPAAHMDLGTVLGRLKTLEGAGPLASIPTERLARAFSPGIAPGASS